MPTDLPPSIKANDRKYLPLIWAVSIIIPVGVGIILKPGLLPRLDPGFDPSILPALHATINATVALLLIAGYLLIRRGQARWHKRAMLSALALSLVFLVSYITYHLSAGHTPYCAEGLAPRSIYFFVLISHILLSVFIVPLALFSVYRGLSGSYDKHRKVAKIALPLWLYMAVSGVLVYLFMAPCY